MKAFESTQNYPSRLREMTNYTVREVKKVCTQIGPRESGEEGERKAQDYVAESMKNVCDSVEKEEFDVHPKAFMGWVVIDVVLLFISVIGFILCRFDFLGAAERPVSIISLVLSATAVVLIIGEFLFYKELLDPLFPKRTTYNVVCTRKSSGETKKRIVFAGHVDSAYEWFYTYLGGGKMLTAVIALAILSMALNLVIDIIGLFDIPSWLNITTLVIAVITLIPIGMCSIFVHWSLVVDGANDNLTGVFASMAVVRFMEANNIRFENTEVVAVSSACEECGLRGAKAYAKKHINDGVETVFIAVDTLRDYDDMGVYNKDMSGTVTLDKQVAAMLKKASETAGLNLPYAKVFFGSSDAAAAQKVGIKSAALAAMDPTPARYYHTRLDKADNLDPKTVEAGINVMLETAFLYDTEGLKDEY